MINIEHLRLNEISVWSPRYTFIGNSKKTLDQTVKDLFSSGEGGVFIDPNDLTTMFQDQAGTIPVTAVGQPVGLILDKSGRNNHLRQTLNHQRPVLRKNAATGANYLEFDGADDFLFASGINLSSTDSVTILTAVRRLNDSVTGTFLEFSINSSTSNGSFSILTPSGGNFSFSSRGTATSTTNVSTSSAPFSAVIVAEGKISTDKANIKVNEASQSQVTDQGSGNYGNYPFYIGRRAGSSQAFAGHVYSTIIVGRSITQKEITTVENFLSKAINVTL